MMLIICLLYINILFLSLGSLSLLRLMLSLELISWIFVVLIPRNFTLNYLIVQSYFLVMGLCRVFLMPFVLIAFFLIKLGIPPFHLWFIRVARSLNKNVFVFIITIHKLVPVLFLRKVLIRYISFVVLSSRLIIVGLSLIRRRTIFFTIIFSSIVHTIWISFRIVIRKNLVILYWFSYRSLLFILLSILGFIKMDQSYLTQGTFTSKCWLLISGIPPFIIFWFKVYLLIWLIYVVGVVIGTVIMLVGVLALTSYYRTWHIGSLLEHRFIPLTFISPFLIVFMFWVRF